MRRSFIYEMKFYICHPTDLKLVEEEVKIEKLLGVTRDDQCLNGDEKWRKVSVCPSSYQSRPLTLADIHFPDRLSDTHLCRHVWPTYNASQH